MQISNGTIEIVWPEPLVVVNAIYPLQLLKTAMSLFKRCWL